MDTNFSEDDLAFRDEVRSFFKEEFDHDMAKRLADNHGNDYKSSIIKWQKKSYSSRMYLAIPSIIMVCSSLKSKFI